MKKPVATMVAMSKTKMSDVRRSVVLVCCYVVMDPVRLTVSCIDVSVNYEGELHNCWCGCTAIGMGERVHFVHGSGHRRPQFLVKMV